MTSTLAGSSEAGVGLPARAAEEARLREAALLRENPNPILECDAAGGVRYANPAAERMWRALGLADAGALLPPDHAERVGAAMRSGSGFQDVEAAVGGRVLAWTYRPHPGTGAVHLFAVEVTRSRRMEERLRYDALHDALTGLPNRPFFMDRLAHALLRSQRRPDYRFAVLFLDLDRFKVVNDSLGHHVGDELLVVVAQRLERCVRPADTVARFGGDEFAVLLEDIADASDATRVAERIQAELSVPVNLHGYEVFTSASIGIALDSIAGERPELLIRNADMAMYRAKVSGEARLEVFDRAMHADALNRLRMESDLRRALERDEFRLHYQPIFCLEDERVVALEALVRWAHPERGWLEPPAFVPIAEETGVILALGEWVIREACKRARAWRDRFPGRPALGITVNLSARQFSQRDLVERVQAILEETGLEPKALKLEITESAVMENAETAAVLLTRLKALGVKIYLDDFGTGYSSLSYLLRFPLDALKVDRSFVGRMDADGRSHQLVHTILALAQSMGVEVVAEGIETAGQLLGLRALGCTMGQGYLLAREMSAAEVDAMLEEVGGKVVGRRSSVFGLVDSGAVPTLRTDD
jgi:diguanylate cyclase (GGDEF)-like protein